MRALITLIGLLFVVTYAQDDIEVEVDLSEGDKDVQDQFVDEV